MQRDACDYSFNVPGAANHRCIRTKGHPSRHVCWCGALHDAGADYTGRWESYIKPELRGSSARATRRSAVGDGGKAVGLGQSTDSRQQLCAATLF
jgi:hypothetical protein